MVGKLQVAPTGSPLNREYAGNIGTPGSGSLPPNCWIARLSILSVNGSRAHRQNQWRASSLSSSSSFRSMSLAPLERTALFVFFSSGRSQPPEFVVRIVYDFSKNKLYIYIYHYTYGLLKHNGGDRFIEIMDSICTRM